ncbi:MAG: glucuronate isomerase [Clostridia bacterium]|nr:glucuronate isomerase [Clostridia bacterium]
MKEFFGDALLLEGESAKEIYKEIKDLPIIDYHCHLDEKAIFDNRKFSDIGELWLSGDHYKWRAMRLCGVNEEYITGDKGYKEKFFKFAEVLPNLTGNSVYYWAHMELRRIFGITDPLNSDSAEYIWNKANEKLKTITVCDLLKDFNVEYIATTDDPLKELKYHRDIAGIKIKPTFRPDACFNNGVDKAFLNERLKYFISKGCKIADHGFDFISENDENLLWLIKVCYENGILLQLHFGTMRNINSAAYGKTGADSGYDVFRASVDTDALARLFDKANKELGGLPRTILYSLNDNYTKAIATISGAFRGIYIGSAWWFNDTATGIRRQMETVSEYAAFGTQIGMLTDSRSFSSYVRFDFYRRILSSFVGEKVDKGEYDKKSAITIAKKVAYYNAKEMING